MRGLLNPYKNASLYEKSLPEPPKILVSIILNSHSISKIKQGLPSETECLNYLIHITCKLRRQTGRIIENILPQFIEFWNTSDGDQQSH